MPIATSACSSWWPIWTSGRLRRRRASSGT